jgi:hypothetical protein
VGERRNGNTASLSEASRFEYRSVPTKIELLIHQEIFGDCAFRTRPDWASITILSFLFRHEKIISRVDGAP